MLINKFVHHQVFQALDGNNMYINDNININVMYVSGKMYFKFQIEHPVYSKAHLVSGLKNNRSDKK